MNRLTVKPLVSPADEKFVAIYWEGELARPSILLEEWRARDLLRQLDEAIQALAPS